MHYSDNRRKAVIIVHRVTLTDGSVVHIHCTGWDNDVEWRGMRRRFRWTVRDASGVKLASGHDLYGGVSMAVTEREMAETFASFVGAWVEAPTYGDDESENRGLFPMVLREWAETNNDELYALTTREGE